MVPLRLVLPLVFVAVLVAGAASHDSKHKAKDGGHHGKPGGEHKHDSHEKKGHQPKPKPKPKHGHDAKPHHGPNVGPGHGPKPHHGPNVGPGHGPKPHHGPNVGPGHGPKPHHGPSVGPGHGPKPHHGPNVGPGHGPKPHSTQPNVVVGPTDSAKPHHKPSVDVSAPADGSGACHVCYASGSLLLVAPESNCTHYFSRRLFDSHIVTLNVCPKGQTFSARLCACSAINDRPCTCSARGNVSSGVTQKSNAGLTLATPAPYPTTSSNKRECSCRRGESRYTPDWSTGCRSYVEVWGDNRSKKHSCPNNQLFSVDKCSCERSDRASCSCPVAVTSPPATPSLEREFCTHGDYVYRAVPRSACKNFTVEAAFLRPIMFSCPVYFSFHVSTCSCISAAHLTDHHSRCHDHSGGAAATLPPGNQTARPHTTPSTPFNGCHCTRNGTTYKPINNCTSFLQSANTTGTRQLDCPTGLLFSADWCVCDRAERVHCRSCAVPPEISQPPPPPRHAADCHFCEAGGNVYTQIADTGCKKFSQRARSTSVNVVHTCPGNLLFDHKACVCNHPDAVHCTCSSSNRTGAATAGGAPASAAGGAAGGTGNHAHTHPGLDKSGCSCVANGNIYRPADDCRAFTQAPVTTPNAVARQSCPGGLRFSTALCTCDWPASTTCHDCSGSAHHRLLPIPK